MAKNWPQFEFEFEFRILCAIQLQLNFAAAATGRAGAVHLERMATICLWNRRGL